MQPLLPTSQAPYTMQLTNAPVRLCCGIVAIIGACGALMALFATPVTTIGTATYTVSRPAAIQTQAPAFASRVQAPVQVPGFHVHPTMQDRARPLASVGSHQAPAQDGRPLQFRPTAAASSALSVASLLAVASAFGVLVARLAPRRASGTSVQWQMLGTTAEEAIEAGQDVVEVDPVDEDDDISPVEEVLEQLEPGLCCPACFKPLNGPMCYSCSLEYEDTGVYLNLTPASGKPMNSAWEAPAEREQESPLDQFPFLKEALPTIERLEKAFPPPAGAPSLVKVLKGGYAGDKGAWGTSTFESPIVSGVYERGWRQSFARAGFPGPDEEFAQAQRWLLPVAKGQTILDASCGSGLFTRRFMECADYSKVIALDFSESMLLETRQGIDKATNLQSAATPVELVRADIARLPFASESLPAIHAGAAIHCWPQPSLAMSEIARVLKPGGRAVLSTFLVPGQDAPFLNPELRQALVTPMVSQGMKYWEERELRALCASVGLVNFEMQKKQDYIMFTVSKPGATLQ